MGRMAEQYQEAQENESGAFDEQQYEESGNE